MNTDATAREQIRALIDSSAVLLFMKGSREAPRCGFSATVVQILDQLIPDYRTVDVLADEKLREDIKEYSSWPTIPQLYVRGEFVGGCDIVQESFASGELHRKLGVAQVEVDERRAGGLAPARRVDELVECGRQLREICLGVLRAGGRDGDEGAGGPGGRRRHGAIMTAPPPSRDGGSSTIRRPRRQSVRQLPHQRQDQRPRGRTA